MPETPAEQPDVQVLRHSQVTEVQSALARLRPKDQELVRLKAWEELSNQQISQILGISDRAVEGRYARTLKKLARSLPVDPSPIPRLAEEGGEA
jgi:RNA polymerase sigma-70 factor (ECF subfamily)